MAPPICASEKVKRGRPTQSRMMGMAIALRPPAIAIGGQSIDLISTPPRLQRAPRGGAGRAARIGAASGAFYNRSATMQGSTKACANLQLNGCMSLGLA